MKIQSAILSTFILLIVAAPVAARNNDPVTICHKPGTPAEHTIVVDNNSVIQAHLRHGDYLGPCVVVEPSPSGDVGTAIETHKPPKERINNPGTTTATSGFIPTPPPSDTYMGEPMAVNTDPFIALVVLFASVLLITGLLVRRQR